MLILLEDEKAEILEYLVEDYRDMPQAKLFEKFCDLYLENYINESDSDALRTGAIDFLFRTHDDFHDEGFPSKELIENQIEKWRKET